VLALFLLSSHHFISRCFATSPTNGG